MQDSWRRLAFYESADFVEDAYRDRHGVTTRQTHAKATEIATNVAQARQYFEAAQLAGDLSRPLLVYYGVMSLSRALVMYLDREKRESNLYKSHGIEVDGWERLGAGGAITGTRFKEVSLKPVRGTFTELCSSTKNIRRAFIETISERVGLYHSKPGTDTVPDYQTFRLQDLLGRVPQLDTVYEMVFGELPSTLQLEVVSFISNSDSTTLVVRVNGTKRTFPDPTTTVKMTGFSTTAYRDSHNFEGAPGYSYHTFQFSTPTIQELCDVLPGISAIPVADSASDRWLYVIAPLAGETHLSLLTIGFLVSHALGMLVRYFPSTWTSLSRRAAGDRVFPLLRAAIHYVETEFPRLALEELEDKSDYGFQLIANPYHWIDSY